MTFNIKNDIINAKVSFSIIPTIVTAFNNTFDDDYCFAFLYCNVWELLSILVVVKEKYATPTNLFIVIITVFNVFIFVCVFRRVNNNDLLF